MHATMAFAVIRNRRIIWCLFATGTICSILGIVDAATSKQPPADTAPDFLTATITVDYNADRWPGGPGNLLPQTGVLGDSINKVMRRSYFTLAELQQIKLPDGSGKTLGDVATIGVSFIHRHNKGVVPSDETIHDVCRHAIKLLEAKKISEFLERCMLPDRLAVLKEDRTKWDNKVKSFSTESAGVMLLALRDIQKLESNPTAVAAMAAGEPPPNTDTSFIGRVDNGKGGNYEYNVKFHMMGGVWYISSL